MAGLGDLGYLSNNTGDGSEPAYRMSMLPLGTYKNPDGTESLGFALPSMIHQPLMAVERLFGSGNFAHGPDYPGNADDMRTLLFSMYGGNALNPVRAAEAIAPKLLSDTGKPSLFGSAIAGAEKPQGFDVWHGSPHDFDKFDISKIGSGEGAQAYGHGLYFAENPEIAKSYQQGLPYKTLKRQFQDALPDDADFPDVTDLIGTGHFTPYQDDVLRVLFRSLIGTGHFTPYQDDVLRALQKDDWLGFDYPSQAISAAYSKNIRDWDPSPELMKALDNSGHLYQAHINASPEDFLHLEKRFGEQSSSVQNALTAILAERQPQLPIYPEYPVEGLMGVARMKPAEIAGALRDQGVPGLSYFDAGSRTAKEGSRNYVLFSDDPVDILHKWRGDTQLYSDTGLSSFFGSALSPYTQDNPQGSYASGGNVADGIAGLRTLPDYGFGPMTPTTVAGYPNDFVETQHPLWKAIGSNLVDIGEFPARATVDQFDRAGTGVAEAMADPSLANITNAGVQSGLAMMSPTLTAVSGLGGMGLAALRDADIIPSAEARRLKRAQPQTPSQAPVATPEVDPVFDKIKDDPSLLALYQQIKVEQNNATRDYPGRNGDASRAEAAGRAKILQGQFADALAKRDAAKQGIYDQQVENANAARDLELSRDRRFSDTEVGKVYDKLGGYAPLVAGFVPGVMSKLAYGPAESLGSKLLRGLTGASFGVGANNVPLVYNSFSTEVDNPEQRAYSAYAYNLPDGHPDKAKAQAMADSLPTLNPLRTQAQDELYDPWKFGERAGMGALEGFAGNELGQMFPGGLGGIFRRSSYQLPPGTGVAVKPPEGPISPVQSGDPAKLLAGNDTVLDRTSRPVGPVSEYSPPALGAPSDIPPAAAPEKPKGGVRRSKSAGTKGPSKPEAILPSQSPPALPDAQSAASGELKRFFGQNPDTTKATGGAVEGSGGTGKAFSGSLDSSVAGRTDHLPITVKAGSYVIPADIVSALGEGNTNSGTKIINHMFPTQPESLHYAAGGHVPIMAAGGETVLTPEQVAAVGGGDLNHGHAILDAWVKRTRNDTINTLKALPGPSR